MNMIRLVSEFEKPPIVVECESTNDLRQEVESDDYLKTCRKLATQRECWYQWNKDRQEIGDLGFRSRLVLPRSRRMQVLRLAHDDPMWA